MESTESPIVEHPADYRKDARLIGNLTVSQVSWATLIVIGALLLEFYLILTAAATQWHLLCLLLTTGGVLQVTHDLAHRIGVVIRYVARHQHLRADVSRPVTNVSDITVQDLIKVQGCEGALVALLDGSLSMYLEVQPAPTRCLALDGLARLCNRLERALLGLSESGVEMTVYIDLEPDLQRLEVERQVERMCELPEDSGLRHLAGGRVEHQWQVAYDIARRSVHTLRLSLHPEYLPARAHAEEPRERVRRAAEYLRKISRGVAEELGGEELRVVPMTPESIRDLATRQLDHVGWWQSEPVQGSAWKWPVGGRLPAQLASVEVVGSALKPGHFPAIEQVALSSPATLVHTGDPGAKEACVL